MPSYARYDVQTFMDWDASVIDRQLGYAHDLFGFTSIRFFLSTIVYRHTPAAFLQKWNTFLLLCAKHELSVLAVAFDRDLPSCTCTTANGSSCTAGPAGCITPDDAFITSGNYRNSSWCPSPGPHITSMGAAGYVANQDQYAAAVFGGKYADDERIYAIEIINEPDEGNLGPFIDWAAAELSKMSNRPLALENTYAGGRAATKAQALASFFSNHCYGGNVYTEMTAAMAAAQKAGKGAFNTEFGRGDTQPYCEAFAGAVAAKVGTYAWELMLGEDQFNVLLPNGMRCQGLVWPNVLLPNGMRCQGLVWLLPNGMRCQGLVWPNGTVYDAQEAACFKNPPPYVLPTPPPLFNCTVVKRPPGCSAASGCTFKPECDVSNTAGASNGTFVYTPALSRTANCWHEWLETDRTLEGEPTTLSFCNVGGNTSSFRSAGKQQLVFKTGHDNGIFTLFVESTIVATVGAYNPATNWWTTVSLPKACNGK